MNDKGEVPLKYMIEGVRGSGSSAPLFPNLGGKRQ